jgi:hypothetical protein
VLFRVRRPQSAPSVGDRLYEWWRLRTTRSVVDKMT